MEKEIEAERISTDSKSVSRNIQRNQRKIGCWSKQQQKKYIEFLSFFRKSLQSRQQRKNNKVFKQMAEFIGSRDGIQCRSHHMKQLRTHKQVRKIISYYAQTCDNLYNQQPRRVFAVNPNQYQQQNVYSQIIWNNGQGNQKQEQIEKQINHFPNTFFPQENINFFPSYSQFQIEPYQYCYLLYTPEQPLYQVYNIQ